MKRVFSVLAVGFVFVACQGYESGAKESFSQSHTCPVDRVQVVARPDLKQSMLRPKSEPPPDVKKDPGRLKMWQDKEDESTAKSDGFCEMWEAKGCDKHEMLCCFRPGKHANRVSCTGNDKIPAGMAKL